MNDCKWQHEIAQEASRLEEDVLHSTKGHFNAGAVWSKAHIALGLPSALLAAWAGLEAFSDNPALTATLALFSASLTAAITFLRPESHADSHRNSAKALNELKTDLRQFRNILLPNLEFERAQENLIDLTQRLKDINSMSLDIPRVAYIKAKKDIDEGRAKYRIDKGESS